MRFEPGQTIVRRIMHWDGRIAAVQSAIVVADDEDGLRIWLDRGAAVLHRVGLDGTPTRPLPVRTELTMPTTLQHSVWAPYRTLMLFPPGARHSIWWSWLGADFASWYVNLERPVRRWAGGIDVHDQQLDLIVWADGRLEWKDEDQFAEQTGDPLYWSPEEAQRIRSEGERLAALAAQRAWPFDGRWCDFTPDPTWAPASIPFWWDVPADRAGIWFPHG